MTNPEIANIIQLMTYPLTIIGLILIIIDIFRNGISMRLENYLDAKAHELEARSRAAFQLMAEQGILNLAELRQDLVNPPRNIFQSIHSTYRSLTRIFSYLGIYANCGVSLSILCLSYFIGFCNRITSGHALVGLGLIFEVICFIGDTYQVIDILKN